MTLAKLLAVFLVPLGTLALLLVITAITVLQGRRRLTVLLLLAAVTLVWVTAMPATARRLNAAVESVHVPMAVTQAPAARAIVVLGGGIAYPGPGDLVRPGPQAGRAWFGARLLQADKAPLLVVSGGGDPPEAQLAGQLLQAWGVSPGQLLLEKRSRTTRENALKVRELLAPRGIGDILLVTSTAHMGRAAPAFHAAGFDVTPFPVPLMGPPPPDEPPAAAWLPSPEALYQTSTLLREGLGQAWYRLRGWN
jgi:uncharacterized SAM-binding protein YcdF (DUF218 family)